MATATMAEQAGIRWPAVLDRLPIALLALAPLALGPPTTGAGLGELLLGLVALVALERQVPSLGAAMLSARRPKLVDLVAVPLALAAAALVRPGLVPIALLFAACLLAREFARSAALAAAATALAAALAVEAGAFLLGGEGDLLAPAAVGSLVLFEGSVRLARTGKGRSGGADPYRLAPVQLAAFCLTLALLLALATGRDLLGPEPSVWTVSSLPLLAMALLVRLGAPAPAGRAERPARAGPAAVTARLRAIIASAPASKVCAQPWFRWLGVTDPAAGDRALRPTRAKPAFAARDRP